MMTKGLSRKQTIISISSKNITKFMKNSSLHVTNINKSLRNVKLDVLVDFIQSDQMVIIVVTSKVALQSDLHIIKNYVKNIDNINSLSMEVLWLLQSKSYLKIIDISYFSRNKSQECLSSSDIENIIKQNQIFDNIVLTSKPQVIKVSLKSDMSIIWIDIWDIQSRSKAKSLINQCFNVGRYIATIREANMNPNIP